MKITHYPDTQMVESFSKQAWEYAGNNFDLAGKRFVELICDWHSKEIAKWLRRHAKMDRLKPSSQDLLCQFAEMLEAEK